METLRHFDYRWEAWREVAIAVGIAVLVTAGRMISDTDFSVATEWDSWGEWRELGENVAIGSSRAGYVAGRQALAAAFRRVFGEAV